MWTCLSLNILRKFNLNATFDFNVTSHNVIFLRRKLWKGLSDVKLQPQNKYLQNKKINSFLKICLRKYSAENIV